MAREFEFKMECFWWQRGADGRAAVGNCSASDASSPVHSNGGARGGVVVGLGGERGVGCDEGEGEAWPRPRVWTCWASWAMPRCCSSVLRVLMWLVTVIRFGDK